MRYVFKFWLFRNSLLLLGVSLLAMIFMILWWWGSPEGDWKARLLLGGAVLSFFYFLQKQQLEETRLMRELITDFNHRYGVMHGELQRILKTGQQERPAPRLTQDEEETLIEYFNLCAEEFLFYDLGYVEPRVFATWDRGMSEYGKDQRIWEFWKRERQSDSYYGFEFPSS